MSDTSEAVVETFLHGGIVVEHGDGAIVARYLDEPHTTVEIRRIGPRTRDSTPIGTRSASDLSAAIDNRSIALSPGRAQLFKRSYRVEIAFDGHVLTLAATNLEDSMLWAGTSNHGDNVFGELTRRFDGGVDIVWSLPFTFRGKTIEPPVPSRDVVIVGVAASAAFGTGGLSATTIAMAAVGSIFP